MASLWKMYALEQIYRVIRYFLFCFYLLFSLFFVISCFLKSLYHIFQLLMHYCDKTKKHCFFLLITGSNFREYNILKKKKLNGNLAGHNLWFTTRFWISMAKFFVIMNLPWQGKKFKESYQWINLGLVKFFTRDYANDHYLWTLWRLNYVNFVLLRCKDTFCGV